MATCKECHKLVRGELRASMAATPVVALDDVLGGGLLVADVDLSLVCPHDGCVIVYRTMEVEELFDHPCGEQDFLLRDATVRPTDQEIIRPDKRSSRRWLGADVTISLECPDCGEEIRVSVTVGDYALEFLTAA